MSTDRGKARARAFSWSGMSGYFSSLSFLLPFPTSLRSVPTLVSSFLRTTTRSCQTELSSTLDNLYTRSQSRPRSFNRHTHRRTYLFSTKMISTRTLAIALAALIAHAKAGVIDNSAVSKAVQASPSSFQPVHGPPVLTFLGLGNWYTVRCRSVRRRILHHERQDGQDPLFQPRRRHECQSLPHRSTYVRSCKHSFKALRA